MPSRIFTIPAFDRFATKARVDDERLIEAVAKADRGLIYADLGGGVIKQAVSRPNESATKGFRTVVGFQLESRAFFLFGFAKNEADNITARALEGFRNVTADLMALTDEQIASLVNSGELREIGREEN